MDKLLSYEQYKAAVSQAKAAGCKLSNCFFLPPAVEALIEKGTLYAQPIENGLLLIDDNGGFYRLYYYLSDEAHYAPLSLDKDAVIEFPFTSQPNAKQQRQIELIGELGFTLGRESALLSAVPDELKRLPMSDSPVELAKKGDAKRVLELICASFNPLYAFIPEESELEEAIEDSRVFVIRANGEIAAILHSGFEKGIAEIKHVAVCEQQRGKGLGAIIVNAYHEAYMDRASGFQQWVDIHNTPAVNLYGRFGYSFSLRKANEYILLRKGDNKMREKLLALLEDIRPDVDFEHEKKLIDGKVLDSFDIISIVQEMNDTFDVEINVEDLEPDNFNTIEAMIELIEKLQAED